MHFAFLNFKTFRKLTTDIFSCWQILIIHWFRPIETNCKWNFAKITLILHIHVLCSLCGNLSKHDFWSPPHCGSVWSDLLVLHTYGVIISECQKVNFLGGQGNTNFVNMWRKKPNCPKWRENWSKMFFDIFSKNFTLEVFPRCWLSWESQ